MINDNLYEYWLFMKLTQYENVTLIEMKFYIYIYQFYVCFHQSFFGGLDR